MGHTVEELPSIARGAASGASASPSGENTVARTGFTTLPLDEPAPASSDDDGALRPSSSPPSPSPTSPKIRLKTDASTINATTRIAPPTLNPIISPLRRRAAASASEGGAPLKRDGGISGSSTGEIVS